MSVGLQTSSASPAALRSFEAQWRARAADALRPAREQAMQRFLKLGLPSPRDETWRYTDLRALAAQSFVDAPHKARGEIQPHAALPLLDGYEAGIMLEVVKDLLYEAYVRKGKLQQAMMVRRFFLEETGSLVAPIKSAS